ncbi:hypothetical protein BJG93_35765 [Paraburkholderia sprentiae WSM5005]|uniref:Uncharacterized protein n=1 Tax=Paraburkholderia sprentiae WSM5005 TaxID=754502 RepID=A0A8F4KII8_9BURK|nr:hypothetical protein [Paraburkholderia sprentiae]QXE07303.1 hypothetical protein BJG93_35765 [Paraburkholderia sprentiae WSM5005]
MNTTPYSTASQLLDMCLCAARISLVAKARATIGDHGKSFIVGYCFMTERCLAFGVTGERFVVERLSIGCRHFGVTYGRKPVVDGPPNPKPITFSYPRRLPCLSARESDRPSGHSQGLPGSLAMATDESAVNS